VFRSNDNGEHWRENWVLATRERMARRPGDYVGLAAARERVYAAYVLPSEGKEKDRQRLYVCAFASTGKRK
jgi:hypothetical protein